MCDLELDPGRGGQDCYKDYSGGNWWNSNINNMLGEYYNYNTFPKPYNYTMVIKKEKTQFSTCVFLPCESPLLLTQNTSLLMLLVTKRFSSPHQAILFDTSQVSCNLTQFWNCLSGDSIRFHRLSAQFHKTAPPRPDLTYSLRTPVASPAYHLCFWPTGCRWEVPMTPPSVQLICKSGS